MRTLAAPAGVAKEPTGVSLPTSIASNRKPVNGVEAGPCSSTWNHRKTFYLVSWTVLNWAASRQAYMRGQTEM